jgi:hypothetical protein
MRTRFRPSHATVVAYVALFVALGGTAMAAVVITSNSQVAKGTISGHHPPAGKHSNLIRGSVNGEDLSGKLKASLRLHCPSGLRRAADTCFEASLRPPATLANALKTCAVPDRRLPTDAELELVFDHSGAPQSRQWVATHHRDASGPNLDTLGSVLEEDSSRNLIFSDTPVDNTEPYRCVTSPTN